jgi:hypothetical protein
MSIFYGKALPRKRMFWHSCVLYKKGMDALAPNFFTRLEAIAAEKKAVNLRTHQ